jgi:GntR family transcriptional regulator, carbon starvation induced regulator
MMPPVNNGSPVSPSSSGVTLAGTLAERLREEITGGRLTPGTKLHLEDLKETFGVSLSPLREALSRLSGEGFVVMQGQRGYSVAPISEANLREVTTLRMETETFALKRAIALGDRNWEGRVVAALHRLNSLPPTSKRKSRSEEIEEWEREHRSFHLALISACDMPLLLQFCTTLHDLSDRYRRLFLQNNPTDRNVQQEHAAISQATISRNSDKAANLLRKHIERTGTNVLKTLTKSGGA